MKNENIEQVYIALLELGFESFYLQSLSDDELLELKEKVLILKAKEKENYDIGNK